MKHKTLYLPISLCLSTRFIPLFSLSMICQAHDCGKGQGGAIVYEAKHVPITEYAKRLDNLRNIGVPAHDGTDRLYVAVKDGNCEKVKKLLERVNLDYKETSNPYDSDFPNRRDKHSGQTALLKAIEMKSEQKVKLLIANEHLKPSLNIPTSGGLMPLHVAIDKKLSGIAHTLIGVLTSDQLYTPTRQFRQTPLHLAVKQGLNDVAKRLVEHKDVLDVQLDRFMEPDYKGKNPLHSAARSNNQELFKMIWQAMCAKLEDPVKYLMHKDTKGRTVLACAYLDKHTKVNFGMHDQDDKMFKYIAGLVKNKLTNDQINQVKKGMDQCLPAVKPKEKNRIAQLKGVL